MSAPADHDPAGRPPVGTLRRVLADAYHVVQCGEDAFAADHPLSCGGRLTRLQLAALEAATREWITTQERAEAGRLARRRAR